MQRLNQSLYSRLDRRTFICLTLTEFDMERRVARVVSCGNPYPLLVRNGTVVELQVDQPGDHLIQRKACGQP